MNENQDVTSFISTVYRVLRELKDIGHTQNKTLAIHKILNCLPPRLSNFVQMIQNERQITTLDELVNRL
jgi:hypothetical protein